MGTSQSVTSEEVLSSVKEYNLMLLTAIKFHFLEESEYGAALRILKTTYLTKEYYSCTARDKESLYKNITASRKESLTAMVHQEYSQLIETKDILIIIYKTLNKKTFRKPDPAMIYDKIYSKSSKLKFGLEYIERKYRKSLESETAFEEIIEFEDIKRPIPPKYVYLINEICRVTSFVFNNEEKRIDYSVLMN